MKEIVRMLNKGIQDDGCYTSKEFKSFARKFKNRIKKQLDKIGGTNLEQNTGHYYVSGFFDYNGQTYYYSISDVRYFPKNDMLIRTAEHHRDFTGGSNHFIELSDTMLEDYFRRTNKCK